MRNKKDEISTNLSWLPSEIPFPVLQVNRDGTICHTNEAGELCLQNWGVAVKGRVPASVRNTISDALSSACKKSTTITLNDGVYTCVVVPRLEESYADLYVCEITKLKRVEEAFSSVKSDTAVL